MYTSKYNIYIYIHVTDVREYSQKSVPYREPYTFFFLIYFFFLYILFFIFRKIRFPKVCIIYIYIYIYILLNIYFSCIYFFLYLFIFRSIYIYIYIIQTFGNLLKSQFPIGNPIIIFFLYIIFFLVHIFLSLVYTRKRGSKIQRKAQRKKNPQKTFVKSLHRFSKVRKKHSAKIFFF